MNESRPLIIRLRNWVGDVVLSVPTLQRLESQGYELHLLGKGFAGALLRGFGWSVYKLEPSFRARVAQLRALRHTLTRNGIKPRSIIFPYSLSSALEARLAGLKATGFATEGRSLLMSQSMPRPRKVHSSEEYWALGGHFLGVKEPAPTHIPWRIAREDSDRARTLIVESGLAPPGSSGFILAVPYASGGFAGRSKHWPAFEQWIASAYRTHGYPVVLCPGPDEEDQLTFDASSRVIVLPKIDLGLFAALSQEAKLVISNDTGPGHLAAAASAPTLSILGPTPVERWGVRGVRARTLQQPGSWPSLDEVDRAASDILQHRESATPSS